jgi:hypothetical protein
MLWDSEPVEPGEMRDAMFLHEVRRLQCMHVFAFLVNFDPDLLI